MRIPLNISFGIVILIFFFNGVLLPFGLQYSLLLTPFFVAGLYFSNKLQTIKTPIFVIFIFAILHFLNGAVLKDLLVSNIVLTSIVILATSFFYFYKNSSYIEVFIEKITILNFIFTLLAVLALFTGIFKDVFWYSIPFTEGYKTIPRLKLFELEASHYSFVLLPFFFYYFWKVIQQVSKKSTFLLFTVSLSLVLSFSLGILSVIFLALFATIIFHFKRLLFYKNARNTLGMLGSVLIVIFVFAYVFYPENPLFYRISNILSGTDTSGRGRTYESFEIAWQTLQNKNSYFGIGLGQFKIVGRMTLSFYYKFMNLPEVVRIPNCMAETLVVYGIVGFVLKILIQIGLFIKFKVYQNLFQLSLFISLFIYQFTGSFLFNGMEYILWVMAFYPVLMSFNQSNYLKK